MKEQKQAAELAQKQKREREALQKKLQEGSISKEQYDRENQGLELQRNHEKEQLTTDINNSRQ